MPKTRFQIGDKVRWNDPAINDYDKEDRQDVLNRVFEIYDIRGEIICISDGTSEAEVFAHELVRLQDDYRLSLNVVESWWRHLGCWDRQHASGIVYHNEDDFLNITDNWWDTLTEMQKRQTYDNFFAEC